MNQLKFFQKLREAGVPMLSRFLDVPPQSVVVMIQHNLLEETLDETYSQMPEEERIKFEAELMVDMEAENKQRNSRTQSSNHLSIDQFDRQIRIAGIDCLIRFLAIDLDTLTELALSEELSKRIAAVHASMTRAEIDTWEREITHIIRMDREKQPIWSKILYDHHEEVDGFIVGYVDAWRTTNEDEEGRVIAQVVGAAIDGNPSVYVVHCDPEARFDEMAKDAIAKCSDEVKAKLNEAILSGQSVVRRRLIREGTLRTYQVLAWIPGHANGECLAQVKLISGDVNGQHLHSLPQVERFIPAGLGEDITQRVDQQVADILNEIQDERNQSQREVPPHA